MFPLRTNVRRVSPCGRHLVRIDVERQTQIQDPQTMPDQNKGARQSSAWVVDNTGHSANKNPWSVVKSMSRWYALSNPIEENTMFRMSLVTTSFPEQIFDSIIRVWKQRVKYQLNQWNQHPRQTRRPVQQESHPTPEELANPSRAAPAFVCVLQCVQQVQAHVCV